MSDSAFVDLMTGRKKSCPSVGWYVAPFTRRPAAAGTARRFQGPAGPSALRGKRKLKEPAQARLARTVVSRFFFSPGRRISKRRLTFSRASGIITRQRSALKARVVSQTVQPRIRQAELFSPRPSANRSPVSTNCPATLARSFSTGSRFGHRTTLPEIR